MEYGQVRDSLIYYLLLVMLNKKSSSKKKECFIQDSNPGPYGYKLICKTIALKSTHKFMVHLGI